jgi:GT2 family glycosyltransferase
MRYIRMVKLSVILVNYNVKYFLEQALHAVQNAMQDIPGEIFVVDNHSVDGSCEMVRQKFPNVKLIENKENLGFSKANNQAIRLSKGEYVLLLNPDTVVQENTFRKVIEFMDATPDAGGVGVKMIDGKGNFLPESKRSLPTPAVAFYKIFGLAALFPKSKRFGKYHLGYLDKNETHSVEVLAGAFMMLRKTTLERTGLLDEDYFMYGEDIDLSYRITQAGYKNYYFPHTTIIHYKGESTKRTSINYVFIFYRAMVVFAQKHYSNKHARLFGLLINTAIYIRAAIAVILRMTKALYKPLLDFGLLLGGLYMIKVVYEQYFKYSSGGEFPLRFVVFNLLMYALLWILGLYIAGAYRKRGSIFTATKGIALGTLLIIVYYAFIPESYRYSRAIILVGTIWALTASYLSRVAGYLIHYKKFNLRLSLDLRTLIVGNAEEVKRVKDLLVRSKASCEYVGYVSTNNEAVSNTDEYLGQVENLSDIVELFGVEEIIFCSKDISAQRIINWMGRTQNKNVQYKIVPEESLFIIGSNSKDEQGDFYTLEINLKLNNPSVQIKKRLLDVCISIVLLVFSPLFVLFVNRRLKFFRNLIHVLSGRYTWVGYADAENVHLLPRLKNGVVSPVDGYAKKEVNGLTVQKLNFLYAKEYSIEKDLQIILGSLTRLGN